MTKRYQFFKAENTSAQEVGNAFVALEAGDMAATADMGVGVVANAGVAQHSTPNLSVDIAGSAVVYDAAGRRIVWAAAQNLDLSVDSNGVPTAVVNSGNSRIVSVFASFARVNSTARTDNAGRTVYYDQDEGFTFIVVAGGEDVDPPRPTLPPDADPYAILLADVTLTFSQTTIVNGDIDTTRRQHYTPQRLGQKYEITSATPNGQLADLLAILNTKDQANGLASLNGSSKITSGQLTGGTIRDVQAVLKTTGDGGLTAPGAAPVGNVGISVTVPGCASGDKLLVLTDARYFSNPNFRTYVTVSENGGGASEITSTNNTDNSTGGMQTAFIYTVGTSGDVVFQLYDTGDLAGGNSGGSILAFRVGS